MTKKRSSADTPRDEPTVERKSRTLLRVNQDGRAGKIPNGLSTQKRSPEFLSAFLTRRHLYMTMMTTLSRACSEEEDHVFQGRAARFV